MVAPTEIIIVNGNACCYPKKCHTLPHKHALWQEGQHADEDEDEDVDQGDDDDYCRDGVIGDGLTDAWFGHQTLVVMVSVSVFQ